ncbi:hypothetical protein [Wolbachia endosymbiont (group A) of Trypoxylon clavicerum]|uniref:hypothetical protein n=1 Tax=Wolbachia endosymbiont (group A) of Trypoxylon clavicerum TaxID=2954064 RepID=UPI00222EDAA4|nr:hypothetical protein [Wolbachia endosymbiont (group A) of Trypoxylon clavicerum]
MVENLGIVFTTAQRAIVKLEDLGIVSQTSQGKRDRVYCATDILNILGSVDKKYEKREKDGSLA